MNWNARYKKAVHDACREIAELAAPIYTYEDRCRLIVTKHLTPLFRELRDEAKKQQNINSL